uniref:C2H2-type domain-containing protein n=1 Tax=Hucho hucho TaxID=62062 RepID=A0A4W5RR66_9TELE
MVRFNAPLGIMHITVRKAADGRMVLSQCQKDHLYHCPFCQPSIFKPRDYASVLTHIESHRLKAVLHREFTIFICHLECREAKHFHCPYCPKTYVNRSDFTKHIPQCESVCCRAPGSTVIAPDVTSAMASAPDVNSATARAPDVTSATVRAPDVTSATVRAPDVTSAMARAPDVTSAMARAPDVTSATAPDVTSATARAPDVTSATARGPGSVCPAVRPAVKRKIKCCNCSLWLNKKNLRKHQLRKHTSAEKDITAHSNLKSQCLDLGCLQRINTSSLSLLLC